MLVVVLRNHLYSHFHSCSCSTLVTRLATSVINKPPSSATCSNKNCAYNTRLAASVATMSTVAIPQQPLPQPLPLHNNHHNQQHSPSDDPTDSAFDSETPTSSRASSTSRRRSRKSQEPDRSQNLPLQPSRMSAFFPLGYKEAASQWVCLLYDALICTRFASAKYKLTHPRQPIVEQPLPARLRARCSQSSPLP